MKDIVLQAEEVALVVAALQRRCTQDARLAGGGRRREFGRTLQDDRRISNVPLADESRPVCLSRYVPVWDCVASARGVGCPQGGKLTYLLTCRSRPAACWELLRHDRWSSALLGHERCSVSSA